MRHAPEGVNGAAAHSNHRRQPVVTQVQREPSDDDENYDDQYLEDLPDTTMLDSVILPAIASVGTSIF